MYFVFLFLTSLSMIISMYILGFFIFLKAYTKLCSVYTNYMVIDQVKRQKGFPGGADGREPACQCRKHKRDVSSIPGLRRSPGGGHGNPLQCFAWRIPWTEEPGRLQSIGLHRVGHD